MTKVTNLLFICSRNQWRSPTAEKVWNNIPNFKAKSAGTSPNAKKVVSLADAKKVVSLADIRWADFIFVMEEKHKNRLIATFTNWIEYKQIYILDIPDNYKYMDLELITEITEKVKVFLKY